MQFRPIADIGGIEAGQVLDVMGVVQSVEESRVRAWRSASFAALFAMASITPTVQLNTNVNILILYCLPYCCTIPYLRIKSTFEISLLLPKL